MQVLLSHFNYNEVSMVPKKFQWVNVASQEDAIAKVKKYVDENGLGGRDWFGGIVRDEKKNPLYCISMYGRVETVEEAAGFINNAKKLLKK